MCKDNLFDNSEILFSYSRAQALEDGELVDVTTWASSTKGFLGGFTVPVALTRALFNTLENIPEGSGEDLRGRAHDVLFMASLAARSASQNDESSKAFSVIVTNRQGQKRKLDLFITIGPGDQGEPVITIGFPEDF